ncbi:MAG: error-prone DNA polymerase [Alphaproteobacteria bacterium]|nr:error-prone DNA polymerase [Alphaproteobacteria bacterium]
MTTAAAPDYAELQVTTNFSFLRGASHPAELALRAHELGLSAIGIADRNTLAGVVRAHAACKETGVKLLVGARLDFADGHPSLICYPVDRAAYGRLAQVLTDGKRRAPKGECHLFATDIAALGPGQVLVVVPDSFAGSGAPHPSRRAFGPPQDDARNARAKIPRHPEEARSAVSKDEEHEPTTLPAALKALVEQRPGDVYLAAAPRYDGGDRAWLARLAALATKTGAKLLATNDVHYHHPARRPLQDVLTCIRAGCTIHAAGYRLHANAERHLKSPAAMARLFRDHPDAVAHTLEIVERCRFALDELQYEYPDEPVPQGRTPQEELERLTWQHVAERYPQGVPAKVRELVEKELAVIARLDYARYFLTVHDIVNFARARGILCQGRGSSANSVVCYVLGITAADPEKINLLFERFVSAERREPPDIDLDFEHERREEVIQHVYEKYGRDRAGIVATVITYRPRSAIRDVGKAMGLSADTIGALANTVWGWGGEDGIAEVSIREAGLDPADRTLRLVLKLAGALIGFPRHLSQHTGGFVITRNRLSEVVPIENAAMEDRTVIEWDKDDLDALGMLKIDVLALGMLTCLRKGLDLLAAHYGIKRELYEIAYDDDSRVYDMLCKADTIGVFQVESRAQMSMLPRLKPRSFYDLVVEVAIVRPGPIQGGMVHPYLRRRANPQEIAFPSEELREVLEKTMGVPLFQEQAMRIAIVGARFSPDEANQLRRAMATFRHVGTIDKLKGRFIEGMVANGYARGFAEACFRQIEGFGEYGFPESHAASFAILVYASAWLKCHYPAVFACAILNSQPMGFYAPAQLVRDARDHGVEVRPVDVNHSQWDCTLEPSDCPGGLALRLGFRQVKGLPEAEIAKLTAARANGYPDPTGLWRRAGLKAATMDTLARADAFGSMSLKRRPALWAATALSDAPLPLFAAAGEEELANEAPVALPDMAIGEEVVADYAALRLSLKRHPLALLRDDLAAMRLERGVPVLPTCRLVDTPDGARFAVAGLVLVRQRPGSAKGVVFMTLEDETGIANLVVWTHVLERFRRVVMGARLVVALGKVQREGEVIHLVAERLVMRDDLLRRLGDPLDKDELSPEVARADEVKHQQSDRRVKILPPLHPRDQASRAMYPSRDFH